MTTRNRRSVWIFFHRKYGLTNLLMYRIFGYRTLTTHWSQNRSKINWGYHILGITSRRDWTRIIHFFLWARCILLRTYMTWSKTHQIITFRVHLICLVPHFLQLPIWDTPWILLREKGSVSRQLLQCTASRLRYLPHGIRPRRPPNIICSLLWWNQHVVRVHNGISLRMN